MTIRRFELERYFAKHEFSARHLLSCSDCEPIGMGDLLSMADEQASQLWQSLRLGYTESQGHPLLRREISSAYRDIASSEVLIGAPEECIFVAMHSLLRPGDHVVCTFPGYQSLYEIARSIRCEVSFWEPNESDGWRFDVDDLESLLRPETRLVVINFPHNPTGSLTSRSEFEMVIRHVRRIGAILLSDEMYRGLEHEPDTMLPAACELYERAISLSGLSKAYGLPGLRVGWLATKDAGTLQRIGEMKDYTTICASAPSEILAVIAMRNRKAIVSTQLERIRSNLVHLDAFFEEFAECMSWHRPNAGPIGFARVLCADDTELFCDELVQQEGIMLVPGSTFSYGTHHVRLGFGRSDLPEVLDRFGAYLKRRYQ